MQFGFIPGCGTLNATFILSQLHEKYLPKTRRICTLHLQIWRKLLQECLGMFHGGLLGTKLRKLVV